MVWINGKWKMENENSISSEFYFVLLLCRLYSKVQNLN